MRINVDRSIHVRPGDWLSKYSMAIYGDINHIDKFWRKNGALYEEIKNKNLVKSGDTLAARTPALLLQILLLSAFSGCWLYWAAATSCQRQARGLSADCP